MMCAYLVGNSIEMHTFSILILVSFNIQKNCSNDVHVAFHKIEK